MGLGMPREIYLAHSWGAKHFIAKQVKPLFAEVRNNAIFIQQYYKISLFDLEMTLK